MNKYKKDILSNKIPLLTIPVKGAKITTALILFKTGSRYETRQNNGISHFLEHLFFKGTKKRPTTLALASELDALGGEFNAFTTKECTGYWIKIANAKLAPALDVIVDMLLHSKFEEAEVAREKGVIIEELNMYEDNPLLHIEDVFEACLYGHTPAGWETIGTKKNINRFKRADILKYLKTQYGARSAYVILAGKVKATDKVLVKKLVGVFKKNNWHNKARVIEKQKSPQLKIAYKNNDQVNLSLGVRAGAINHPDEYKIRLLALILGGAMSSRLFIRLRERNSLAYYVRTLTEFYSDSGYLTTQAGVPVDKVPAAVKIILEEYRRLTKELVSAAELKRVKEPLAGKLLLQMEASDNLANWYGRQAISRAKIITPAQFVQRIKKISAADLRQTARRIFVNKRLNLAIIGAANKNNLRKILHF
jgi:predicted Zn-dependent peptidase